jgi:hypothetical protein
MEQHPRKTVMSARLFALALVMFTIPLLPTDRQQGEPTGLTDLASIFDDGPLLQDRNGDGLIDYVRARACRARRKAK